MAKPTTWAFFGPDEPYASLPAGFRRCLPPYDPPGVIPAGCDDVVGAAVTGQGWCSLSPYNQMTYCACVNASAGYGGCPGQASTYCANSAHSYKPAVWFAPPGPGADTPWDVCAKNPICINLVEVGGEQNVVAGIDQQCGTITNVSNVVETSPAMAGMLFILFVILILVVMTKTSDGDSGGSVDGNEGLPDISSKR